MLRLLRGARGVGGTGGGDEMTTGADLSFTVCMPRQSVAPSPQAAPTVHVCMCVCVCLCTWILNAHRHAMLFLAPVSTQLVMCCPIVVPSLVHRLCTQHRLPWYASLQV